MNKKHLFNLSSIKLLVMVILPIITVACCIEQKKEHNGIRCEVCLGYLVEDFTTNSIVTLSVDVNCHGQPLGGYEMIISYDTAVVTLVRVEPGNTREFGTQIIVEERNLGSIFISSRNEVSLDSPTGNTQVAKFDFFISGQKSDYTDFELSVLSLFDTTLSPLTYNITETGLLVDALAPIEAVFSMPLQQESKSWDEVKDDFEKMKQKWAPLVDKIKEKKKEFGEAKGDKERRRRIFMEINRLIEELNEIVASFLKSELKALLADEKELKDLIAKLDDFTLEVSPWLSSLGSTNKKGKKIKIKLDILEDVESLFSTIFHEAVHATEGTEDDPGSLDYFADELWTLDQENKFLGFIGEEQNARQSFMEWNYTFRWKEKHGLLEKKENDGYEVTDKGKKIADCYFNKLKAAGWQWEKQPSDALGVIFYNQEKWKTQQTRHSTKSGKEFVIITATDQPCFGKGGYDPKDPCD